MELILIFLTAITLLVFFYYQDRNREPLKVLIEAFILGFAISLQIEWLQSHFQFTTSVLIHAFILAGLIEEAVKLGILRVTLFRNPHFEKRVDGITYAVFVSIGFAVAENLFLALTIEEAIVRSFTAIPAHALFGVSMGFYLAKYKFDRKLKWLGLALVVPALLHGVYNFLIMVDIPIMLLLFIPYVILLWIKGLLQLNKFNRKIGDKNEELDKK